MQSNRSIGRRILLWCGMVGWLSLWACHVGPADEAPLQRTAQPAPWGSHTMAVVGGKVDLRYPAVGALTINKKSKFCSGTLITPQLILTAGHCVTAGLNYKKRNKLYFRVDTATTGSKFTSTYHEIVTLLYHPGYKKNNAGIFDDLGVLVLKAKLAKPVPIQVNTTLLTTSWLKRNVRIMGYGKLSASKSTNTKHSVEIPIRRLLDDRFETYAQGKSMCSGDSGGPALATIAGKLRVVGVNSYVTSNKCTASGFCFRVDTYADWLQPLINKHGGSCRTDGDCLGCFRCRGGSCQKILPTLTSKTCGACNSPSDCGSSASTCIRRPEGNRCLQACSPFGCCPKGYTCQNIGFSGKRCVPATNTCPDIRCSQDKQCSSGEQCRAGVCRPKPVRPIAKLCKRCTQDSECGLGNLCVAYTEGKFCAQACVGNNFCPPGYSCSSSPDGRGRQCIPAKGYCACGKDEDCDKSKGYRCNKGICQIPGGGKYLAPCDQVNQPCGKDYRCLFNGTRNVCLRPCENKVVFPPGTAGSICRAGRFCDEGNQCFASQGTPPACFTTCDTNATRSCPNGGSCLLVGPRPTCICTSDKDCKNGRKCNKTLFGNAGVCATPYLVPSAKCEPLQVCRDLNTGFKVCLPLQPQLGQACDPRTNPCASGFTCARGRSGPAFCYRTCPSSGSCPNGERCLRTGNLRICICDSSARCPRGFSCKLLVGTTGYCRKGQPTPSCRNTVECAKGLICQGGRCITPPQCRSNKDCRIGQICQRGKCIKNPGCAADSDCPPQQFCRQSKCVTLQPEPRPEPPPKPEPRPEAIADIQPDAGVVQEAGITPNDKTPSPKPDPATTPGQTTPPTCGCQQGKESTPSGIAILGLCFLMLFRRRRRQAQMSEELESGAVLAMMHTER